MSKRSADSLSRRNFVQTVAAGAAIVGVHSQLPVARSQSPNEKLKIAAVGAAGRAAADIDGVSGEQIVAIADVDSKFLEQGVAKYQGANGYRDFRQMLEKEAENIDAVVVGTPDHTHAPASAMAMRLKKHCYCEKPLTHTALEARTLTDLARENKLATQMGTQIHAGSNYRRVVELIQAGAIGPVKEAHVWVGVDYSGGKFTTGTPAPANLDWDLWLGPAAERPYSEGVHPFNWRKFWAFGTGGLGDFFCHYVDLAHWALDLKYPTKVSAKGSPVDPVSCPSWAIVDYDYPARGDQPPVHLTWYDGGRKPELLKTLKDEKGQPIDWRSGQLFVGEKGMLLSDYGRHVLLPVEKFVDFERPEPTIPESIGHHQEWLKAIRDGGETTCNFGYAGPLTEAVMLGVAAYKSGETIEWNGDEFEITNKPELASLLHKEYRKGWTL
ncbi:MAG TPA: Gfo/Idh/MocA family oxidoreductase [Pirellulaceae bacterium]|jgi:predicted dehydrogenase|nr:Gfo/Idh/MocA family oxidoreductase [Pirellulaceae bacterium]